MIMQWGDFHISSPIQIQDQGTSPYTLLPISFWVLWCTPFISRAYKCPEDIHA